MRTPDPFGSLPHQQSLAGRPVQRRFEAAEDPLADRLAVGPSGIDDQGRGAVGAGGSHAPSGSPNRDPSPVLRDCGRPGFASASERVESSRDATGRAWRVEATLTRVVQNNGLG